MIMCTSKTFDIQEIKNFNNSPYRKSVYYVTAKNNILTANEATKKYKTLSKVDPITNAFINWEEQQLMSSSNTVIAPVYA